MSMLWLMRAALKEKELLRFDQGMIDLLILLAAHIR